MVYIQEGFQCIFFVLFYFYFLGLKNTVILNEGFQPQTFKLWESTEALEKSKIQLLGFDMLGLPIHGEIKSQTRILLMLSHLFWIRQLKVIFLWIFTPRPISHRVLSTLVWCHNRATEL